VARACTRKHFWHPGTPVALLAPLALYGTLGTHGPLALWHPWSLWHLGTRGTTGSRGTLAPLALFHPRRMTSLLEAVAWLVIVKARPDRADTLSL
jgi:hypothetical protein